MAAHRHWRILININGGGSFTGFSEIELRGALGGPDLTGTGTASSTTLQAGPVTNGFNNSGADVVQWNGNGQAQWIAYDFGAGIAHDIAEVALLPNKDGANRTPVEMVIQSSDDGASWANEWAISYTPWVIGTTVAFAKPAKAPSRYWRVRGVQYQTGAALSCAECELRSAPGGADQTAVGGAAFARTVFSGFPAASAFDDNNATLYSSNGGVLGSEWLAYDFGAGNVKTISEIAWRARSDGNATQNPITGSVEASPDGINWLPHWSYATPNWVAGEQRIFTDPAYTPPPPSPRRRQAAVVN